MKNDILQYASKVTKGLVVSEACSLLVRLRPFGQGRCLIGLPGFKLLYYSQVICGLLSTSHDLGQGCVWGSADLGSLVSKFHCPCVHLFAQLANTYAKVYFLLSWKVFMVSTVRIFQDMGFYILRLIYFGKDFPFPMSFYI